MKTYNNEEFVKLITQGDEEAFTMLYEKYHRLVYYIAFKTMRTAEDAKDVAQNTFIRIQRSIHTVRNPEYLPLWISRITVNECNLFYRRKKETQLFDEDQYEIQKLPALQKEPNETMRFQSDKEMLLYFLDQLPAGQRLVLTLMYFQQLEVKEIAEICDLPEGTVKTRLMHGRAKLKQMIENYQQKEKVKLDFHVDTWTSVLAIAMQEEAIRLSLKTAFLPKKVKMKQINWYAGLVGIATAVCIVGGCIVYGMQEAKQADSHAQERETASFLNKDIQSKEAYYRILMWANTEMLIQQKLEDIEQYRGYYEFLKKQDDGYWKQLKNSEIVKFFEK